MNILLFLSIVALSSPSAAAGTTPRSKKPQTPPQTPAIFGENSISTSDDEFGGSMTPDGDTIFFSRSAPHSYRYTMLQSHREHGKWTTPTVLPFSGKYSDSDPTLSPDGTKMFWTSDRPVDGKIKHDYDLWMVERSASGKWSAPEHLPAPINSETSEFAASMTRSGTLYFSSARDGGIQAFRSHLERGAWTTPENVTRLIDHGDTTVVYDLDVMIDPEERFLLLGSIRSDGFGNFDLFIAWNENGRWSRAVHLPAPFNTRARDYAPHLSPDGRTLLFASERSFALDTLDHALTYRELIERLHSTLNGSGNIYEIDAALLQRFRPASP